VSLFYRALHRLSVLFIILPLLLALNVVSNHPPIVHGAMPNFVSRSGSQLLLNGQPFRFSGANLYWLGLDENTASIDYPTNFRVDDALTTAIEMGATVVRAHTLGTSVGCSKCIEPALGQFNEEAGVKVDYAIMSAGKLGVKLVIPFTDNYKYYHGGKSTFTGWRGVNETDFYTNPQVINDFKQYISVILNRVNTYTGIAYKDDPTILAWETGNELFPPASWTGQIADYIKSIDANHLVADGRYGLDLTALSLNNVDLYSDHFYPLSVVKLNADVALSQQANKPMIIGEYDWANKDGGSPLPDFLATIENNSGIAGDFYWSLFGHNDPNGYVQHRDGYSLHYPGDTSDMRNRAQLLRLHANKQSNLTGLTPSLFPNGFTPLITSLVNNGSNNILNWRGVAVADRYSIERSTNDSGGPWTVICDECVSDNDSPWSDPATPPGKSWYRVRPYSLTGLAGDYSAVALIDNGSVSGRSSVRVDDLNDWSKTYSHTPDLSFDTTNSSYFEGDISRVRRNKATNQEIVWKQADIISFETTSFFWPSEGVSQISFFISKDGLSWNQATPSLQGGSGNWTKYTYSLNNLSNTNYIKLRWNNTGGVFWNPQVGRVVITSLVSDTDPIPAVEDNLSDWSKTYAHSANLSFDTTNSRYFEGDASRVKRNSSTAEEIVWKQLNLKNFNAVTYFWTGEPVSQFSFFTSEDGLNWNEVTPAITNGGGNWLKYNCSLTNLSGINFIKLRWNNLNGVFWNAQVSKVNLSS